MTRAPLRGCTAVISGATGDLGEAIYAAAVAAGWTLSEIRREAATLEQVFTSLTGKES